MKINEVRATLHARLTHRANLVSTLRDEDGCNSRAIDAESRLFLARLGQAKNSFGGIDEAGQLRDVNADVARLEAAVSAMHERVAAKRQKQVVERMNADAQAMAFANFEPGPGNTPAADIARDLLRRWPKDVLIAVAPDGRSLIVDRASRVDYVMLDALRRLAAEVATELAKRPAPDVLVISLNVEPVPAAKARAARTSSDSAQ